jgi:hypothetical protein
MTKVEIQRAVRFNTAVVRIITAALHGRPIVTGNRPSLAAIERCLLLTRCVYTDELTAKFPEQRLFEVLRVV